MVQVRLFPLYSNFSPSPQHSVSCVIVTLRETSCIRRVSVSNAHIFSIYLSLVHRGQGSKLLYHFDGIRFSFATNKSNSSFSFLSSKIELIDFDPRSFILLFIFRHTWFHLVHPSTPKSFSFPPLTSVQRMKRRVKIDRTRRHGSVREKKSN